MKKSVILAIGLVYIVAIVVVGLFGQKMHVYDPIVYATSVVCHSENYKEYNEEQKEKFKADGTIVCTSFVSGMRIELKCQAIPNDVTNRDLNYIYDNQKFGEEVVLLTKNSDYTASLTFYKVVPSLIITVKSADAKGAKIRIRIVINDLSSIL